jgi:hypothetical protein
LVVIFIQKIYTITNNLPNFGVKRVQIIFHAMLLLVIVSLANGYRSVSGRVWHVIVIEGHRVIRRLIVLISSLLPLIFVSE